MDPNTVRIHNSNDVEFDESSFIQMQRFSQMRAGASAATEIVGANEQKADPSRENREDDDDDDGAENHDGDGDGAQAAEPNGPTDAAVFDGNEEQAARPAAESLTASVAADDGRADDIDEVEIEQEEEPEDVADSDNMDAEGESSSAEAEAVEPVPLASVPLSREAQALARDNA